MLNISDFFCCNLSICKILHTVHPNTSTFLNCTGLMKSQRVMICNIFSVTLAVFGSLTWNALIQCDKLTSRGWRNESSLTSNLHLINNRKTDLTRSLSWFVMITFLHYFDSASLLRDQRFSPERNRCLLRALWTIGGKCTRPRGLVCPGCGIIFCNSAEMPFLLHWLCMQETATGMKQPIERQKERKNILWHNNWC